jgi:hypothetical protein
VHTSHNGTHTEEIEMTSTATAVDTTPVVGAPATILLWTDTQAAVVTRVSASNIWVRTVETGEGWTDNQAEVDAGGYPVRLARGILDKPVGGEQRFARHDDTNLHGNKGRGAVKVRIGTSIERRDYRD